MALIHDHSCECSLSPLEWFRVAPTQTAVEKTYDVEYQPLSSIRNNAPIEFYIPASTDDYIDLKNTKLCVQFKILQSNGTDCDDQHFATPINDIFNGLWSNVELFMNDRLISHSNNTHGYTSIISHLIHDSEESLQSERAMRLLYKDTAGSMDSTTAKTANIEGNIAGFNVGANGAVLEEAGNHGLHMRYLHTHSSAAVSVMGSLRIDMFEQERYLPNGISLKLRFHQQKDSYMLLAAANNYRIKILEAVLLVRKVKASPGVQLGHVDAMMKATAKFPVTRKECKVLAVPRGFQTFIKDNIFLGQLPKRVVVGMVDNDAFAGTFAKNPYNFKHFNANFIQMYADGEPILNRALRPNIVDNKYLDSYYTLFKGFDKLSGEKSSIIKREDWPRGYSLFAFDLTPDYDDDDHYPLIRHGNLRLEINFNTALASTINIIVYAEFDNIIEISSNRTVQFDYQS